MNRELPDFNGPSLHSVPFELSEDVPKDEDVTTFRIRFAKVARLLFNPLLLPAAISFEKDIRNIVRTINYLLTHGLIIFVRSLTQKCASTLCWPTLSAKQPGEILLDASF